MIIRYAEFEDCGAVYKLTKNTPELVNPSSKVAPDMWWIESFVREKQIFFVAVEDEKIIGFVMGERTSGDVGLMWMMAVEKRYRGLGIGKKLLYAFEDECKKRKFKAIVAYGHYESERVISLLEHHDYHKGNLFHEFVKNL